MQRTLLTCLFLVLTATLLSAQAPGEETIKWTPSQKLNWDDYKGSPDPASDAAASTTTYLGIEYNIQPDKFDFKITSSFSKSRSWGRHKTEHVLSHEQGHFDIAEIFARKLNKAMSEYQFNRKSYKTDLRKIYRDMLDQKDALQNQYDRETNHSINREKQAEWQIKIAADLAALHAFAGY